METTLNFMWTLASAGLVMNLLLLSIYCVRRKHFSKLSVSPLAVNLCVNNLLLVLALCLATLTMSGHYGLDKEESEFSGAHTALSVHVLLQYWLTKVTMTAYCTRRWQKRYQKAEARSRSQGSFPHVEWMLDTSQTGQSGVLEVCSATTAQPRRNSETERRNSETEPACCPRMAQQQSDPRTAVYSSRTAKLQVDTESDAARSPSQPNNEPETVFSVTVNGRSTEGKPPSLVNGKHGGCANDTGTASQESPGKKLCKLSWWWLPWAWLGSVMSGVAVSMSSSTDDSGNLCLTLDPFRANYTMSADESGIVSREASVSSQPRRLTILLAALLPPYLVGVIVVIRSACLSFASGRKKRRSSGFLRSGSLADKRAVVGDSASPSVLPPSSDTGEAGTSTQTYADTTRTTRLIALKKGLEFQSLSRCLKAKNECAEQSHGHERTCSHQRHHRDASGKFPSAVMFSRQNRSSLPQEFRKARRLRPLWPLSGLVNFARRMPCHTFSGHVLSRNCENCGNYGMVVVGPVESGGVPGREKVVFDRNTNQNDPECKRYPQTGTRKLQQPEPGTMTLCQTRRFMCICKVENKSHDDMCLLKRYNCGFHSETPRHGQDDSKHCVWDRNDDVCGFGPLCTVAAVKRGAGTFETTCQRSDKSRFVSKCAYEHRQPFWLITDLDDDATPFADNETMNTVPSSVLIATKTTSETNESRSVTLDNEVDLALFDTDEYVLSSSLGGEVFDEDYSVLLGDKNENARQNTSTDKPRQKQTKIKTKRKKEKEGEVFELFTESSADAFPLSSEGPVFFQRNKHFLQTVCLLERLQKCERKMVKGRNRRYEPHDIGRGRRSCGDEHLRKARRHCRSDTTATPLTTAPGAGGSYAALTSCARTRDTLQTGGQEGKSLTTDYIFQPERMGFKTAQSIVRFQSEALESEPCFTTEHRESEKNVDDRRLKTENEDEEIPNYPDQFVEGFRHLGRGSSKMDMSSEGHSTDSKMKTNSKRVFFESNALFQRVCLDENTPAERSDLQRGGFHETLTKPQLTWRRGWQREEEVPGHMENPSAGDSGSCEMVVGSVSSGGYPSSFNSGSLTEETNQEQNDSQERKQVMRVPHARNTTAGKMSSFTEADMVKGALRCARPSPDEMSISNMTDSRKTTEMQEIIYTDASTSPGSFVAPNPLEASSQRILFGKNTSFSSTCTFEHHSAELERSVVRHFVKPNSGGAGSWDLEIKGGTESTEGDIGNSSNEAVMGSDNNPFLEPKQPGCHRRRLVARSSTARCRPSFAQTCYGCCTLQVKVPVWFMCLTGLLLHVLTCLPFVMALIPDIWQDGDCENRRLGLLVASLLMFSNVVVCPLWLSFCHARWLFPN